MTAMYILGINSAYHESSACLLRDGELVAAAEEERFTRKKHAKAADIDNPDELPLNAIRYCLEAGGIGIEHVEKIGFSINPIKRLENKAIKDITVDGSWGSPSGEDKFFQQLSLVPQKLGDMGFNGEFIWVDHHLCHAASAFYLSPFDEAAVISVDGIGEVSSTVLAYGQGNDFNILRETNYPASLGFLWEKLSKFLGFTEYDACKVMGLAAYGDPERYAREFKRLVNIISDGNFEMDNNILRFRKEDYSALEQLFHIKKRERHQELASSHRDIAASLQKITDEVMFCITKYLYEKTQSSNLCMAGGVALNCTTNRLIYELGRFSNLYIQPAANDAGTAIGAALFIWHTLCGDRHRNIMNHAYLGPSFSDHQVMETLEENKIVYERIDDIEKMVAQLLSQSHIVGWFQGAMEVGPRALGNRSLLADPRKPDIRNILNEKVKHREDFRPFAPSVLLEEAHEWFHIQKSTYASDFMLIAYPVRDAVINKIPSVVHADLTSRIQTVRKETNERYHKLISEFFKITGVPLVLNTSFNDSEPIVCTPQHAIDTFMKTGIDYLAIGDFLIDKRKQGMIIPSE
jgi:carbamoyltransferase